MMRPPSTDRLVLVVEDDADAREMYEVVLGAAGFRVESAGNGVDAVSKATALRPNVILMDLSLPSMDGREAGRQLKERPATRDIPIVALSGTPIDTLDEEDRVFAAALMKPCFPDDLVAAVRRLVGAHHT